MVFDNLSSRLTRIKKMEEKSSIFSLWKLPFLFSPAAWAFCTVLYTVTIRNPAFSLI